MKVRIIDESAERIRRITERMRSLRDSQTTSYVGGEKMIDLSREDGKSESKPAASEKTASAPKSS